MKPFILGLTIGILFVPLAVFLYCASGSVPTAVSGKPMPFERSLARTALHARMEKEMPRSAPPDAGEANLSEGARIYRGNCAVCHGLPGVDATAIAKGMFPTPPQLLGSEEGVTDDPPGESYWKVANGIRLTGMPGYSKTLSETQIWQVSLLVANANKLPASARALLAVPAESLQPSQPVP